METKEQILATLKDEFNRWEALLGGFTEAQITNRQLPSYLSVKDVIAHLHAWQTRSVARLEAAVNNTEPVFPDWPTYLDNQPDGQPHAMNAWIHSTNRDKTWAAVHDEWRANFRRLLELGEAVPEADLLEPGKYPWLDGHPLSIILVASYEHHHLDHYEPLEAWLTRHGNIQA